MKKKIIIPFLSIFALASCSVNINNSSTPSESTSEANASSSKPSATVNETSKIDVDLLALKNIASKYNDKEYELLEITNEETLSKIEEIYLDMGGRND